MLIGQLSLLCCALLWVLAFFRLGSPAYGGALAATLAARGDELRPRQRGHVDEHRL